MSKAFDFDDDDDFDCQPKGGLGMKATLSRKSSNSSSLSATSSLSSKDGIHRKLSSKTYGKVCPKVASLNPTSHAESQEEDVVVVTLDGVEKGESQAKVYILFTCTFKKNETKTYHLSFAFNPCLLLYVGLSLKSLLLCTER